MNETKFLLIGALGNMGRRYHAVLKSINPNYDITCIDYGDDLPLDKLPKFRGGIIVATPTNTHYGILDQLAEVKNCPPILCEKPVCKSFQKTKEILDKLAGGDVKFSMVNQYRFLVQKPVYYLKDEITFYDYYHSGQDGLGWDHINIIGESSSAYPTIKSESPIWNCIINGKKLCKSNLDQSYVDMIRDWLKNHDENYLYTIRAHKKVEEYLLRCKQQE